MNRIISFLREVYSHWSNKNAARMGAALSYYAIFSLGPLLVIGISLTTLFFSRGQILGAIDDRLSEVVGHGTSSYILSFAGSVDISQISLIGGAISVALLVISAIGVLNELNSDLDELLPATTVQEETTILKTIKHSLKERITAFSIIPLMTLLLIGVLIASIILARFPGLGTLSNALTILIAVIAFAIMFKILPAATLPWSEVWLGALVTSLLFFIGKLFIGYYITNVAGLSVYGAAGSLIAVMIWVYYSAQIVFVGAAFLYVYARRHGSLVESKPSTS